MDRQRRRQFLHGAGTVGAVGIAGCAELFGGSTPEDTPDNEVATSIEHPTTIDEPGAYELGADLSAGETCVEIRASDVTLDGRGHTVTADAPDRDQHGIHVTGDRATITDVEVRGWDERGAGVFYEGVDGGDVSGVTAAENRHGIRLFGSADTVVSGNTVRDNGEFGVVLDGAAGNTVRDNVVTGNVESGVLLWESANNGIAGNTIRDNDLVNNLGGIHLDGDRSGSDGNELSANELSANGDTAIVLIGSNGNDVTDNVMEDNGRHGIFLEGSSDNTLAGNTATGNDISGIDLAWESDGNTIEANTLNDNRGHGIWLIDSHGNDIADNATVGNDQVGIILADASENVIAGNEVADNTLGGIDLIGEEQYTSLVGSHRNEVSDNEVSDNEARDGAGIRLLHSDDNALSGNTVTGTDTHGVALFAAVGNELAENTVSGNADDGIHLGPDVGDLAAASNLLRNNGVGVGVDVGTTESVAIDANDIVNNDAYGVVVRDTGTGRVPEGSDEITAVDATDNWWGDPTGPSHPRKNPDGTGDRASDNVDFEPWAETPFRDG